MNVVDRAIEAYGGGAALARRLGISRNAVSEWRAKQRIPVERVLDLERLTGIPRHELRPDIYPAPRQGEAA
ncbi:MAG TPA: Cro/CI family transcriptional regulator [Microvirga sp.]|jgi:DNA-binding transcriptional regulator YdaS (Cro superfamily)|nr:Cro/CI family transcriptional regulator [Microvirga sp.]